MKNKTFWGILVVIAALFLPYTINFGLVGPSMQQSFAQRGDAGTTFTFTDSDTGRKVTGTVIANGPMYRLPEGYHRSGAVRCVSGAPLESCVDGTATDFLNDSGERITLYTHANVVYLDQFRTNHTILPFTVVGPVNPRTSMLEKNEAWAVGSSGGVTGPPGSAIKYYEIVNIVKVGPGDYFIGYVAVYEDGYLVAGVDEIYAPGGILL